MRLVAGVLALTLFASFAHAEAERAAEPAKVTVPAGKIPLRVVRVMAQSHQALLFDRSRATHVLAEVGGKIDGFTVESIDDDEVTLSLDGTQIVLAAPARGGNRRHDRDLRAAPDRPVAAASPADVRTGDPRTGAPMPIDPYGEPLVRAVEAPGAAAAGAAAFEPGHASLAIEAGQGGIRVAEAPGSTAPASEAPAGQSGIRVAEAPAGVPSVPVAVEARPIAARPPEPQASARPPDVRAADAVRAPDRQTLDARALADVMSADSRPRDPRPPVSAALPPAPPAPATDARPAAPASDLRTVPAASGAVVLSRGDVDGALADFAQLAAAVRGSFSASGLTVDAVGEGSIFARAGLRAGDVVTAVDGAPLRSLDDAANLYARAPAARALTAQIVRGGTPMTLHVAIR